MSARDFDFFFGSWRVAHRRRNKWLADCSEWLDFTGTCTTIPTLGGQGNMDDNVLDLPGGAYRAVTLRAFDPKTQEWAIWWLDGRNPHTLDAPMKGSFVNGVGTFFADETIDGKPIKVRFIWSEIGADTAHWQQAFSPDGGQTWETNWEMRFTRTA